MDKRTDQQYFPVETQFYISAMFVGFPDEIHEERPSFLDASSHLYYLRPRPWVTVFLDASSHLYKRVCPSVRRSVRPSVGPSVCHAFLKNAWNWEFYVQKWSRRHSKPWITSKQLSRISTTKGGYCRTQISSSHLSHLYMRICPKMLEDASLAAGPCY